MSNDLISRSALINLWKELQQDNGNLAQISTFIMSIEKMPTAFDLEKIIKKINAKQFQIKNKLFNVSDEEFAVILRGQLRGMADCLDIIMTEIAESGGTHGKNSE